MAELKLCADNRQRPFRCPSTEEEPVRACSPELSGSKGDTLNCDFFFSFLQGNVNFIMPDYCRKKRKTTASNRVQTKKASVQKYRGLLGAGTRTAATSGGDRNNLDFQLFTEQSAKNSKAALTLCLFSRWHH